MYLTILFEFACVVVAYDKLENQRQIDRHVCSSPESLLHYIGALVGLVIRPEEPFVFFSESSGGKSNASPQGVPKEWKQCGLPTSVGSQYLSSFYFIICTMMTVGYGDQHADPSSNKARKKTLF